ncbi:MAG TPA: dihydropteroate synthase [Chitinophagaceae bacterium]|nr:dihydropteroate synthase [Chitinophagaceae bacterium]
MGIINITPDSFYSGSRHVDMDDILKTAEKMIKDGAAIIDVGAQSTRPGSEQLSPDEEIERIGDIISSINKNFPDTIISIDTFHSAVAVNAVNDGASMVNDISGGSMDSNMISAVAKLNVPYICMHIKGTPATMQQHAKYDNITLEVLDYFVKKIDACRKAGIKDVIIDPGFGFAKTIEQNFELLNNLQTLKMLDAPILCGLSRKSTIYRTLNITADEALNGTTVMNTIALLKGASILRVHDVKEAVECVKLVESLVVSRES